jgi:hypothetical protein
MTGRGRARECPATAREGLEAVGTMAGLVAGLALWWIVGAMVEVMLDGRDAGGERVGAPRIDRSVGGLLGRGRGVATRLPTAADTWRGCGGGVEGTGHE